MAANMYLALKIGMTFATTLPAAVISMAVLSRFKGSNILENTVVQTFVSTGGTLSAIVFALPALIIVGTWSDFPYWQTTLIAILGGLLGVFFTIPLRRALIVESEHNLPFPEGQAAAEVLKVGENIKNKDKNAETGIRFIIIGAILAAVMSFLISGFKVLAGSIGYIGKIGKISYSVSSGYGLALVGAGYLIDVRLVLWMLAGSIFANIFLNGYFSFGLSNPDLSFIYAEKIRYIGVGSIAVAAIWSVIILINPLITGIRRSIKNHQKAQRHYHDENLIPRTEKDLPLKYLSSFTIFATLPLIALFSYYIGSQLHENISTGNLISLIIICVFLTLLIGFIISTVSGYMAGLVGSSTSPVSGLIYLTAIILALILAFVAYSLFGSEADRSQTHHFLVGLVLFATSIIIAMACIANDNLQDLKTGQVVGATPWKQQVVLMMGVVTAALVIAPVFDILYNAYGLAGAPMPHANMNPAQALASPQSNLAAALVKGIIVQKMNWLMLLTGVIIGVVLIIIDQMILRPLKWPRLSLFAFAIAVYLPMSIIFPIVLGGILSYFVERKLKKTTQSKEELKDAKTPGVLIASGLIVGEALISILIAGVIGYTENQDAMAIVGNSFAPIAYILAPIVFIVSLFIIYRCMLIRIKH